MPIHPELLHYYRTPEWFAVRDRVRRRAKGRCEWCGAPNHKYIWRANGGVWLDPRLGQWRDSRGDMVVYAPRKVREGYIVLTTAHLNHDPADHEDDNNLAALCQRCHLVYDGPHHRRTARLRRDRETGQLRLELEGESEDEIDHDDCRAGGVDRRVQ